MLLRGAGDLRIVGEAADGEEALARVAALAPDVVLMDIRMPRMDGLAATERLRARQEAPEVVVLTTYDVDEYVLRALRAGASGFLLKDTPPEEIVRAIRLVAGGEAMLSPPSPASSCGTSWARVPARAGAGRGRRCPGPRPAGGEPLLTPRTF